MIRHNFKLGTHKLHFVKEFAAKPFKLARYVGYDERAMGTRKEERRVFIVHVLRGWKAGKTNKGRGWCSSYSEHLFLVNRTDTHKRQVVSYRTETHPHFGRVWVVRVELKHFREGVGG